MLFRSKREIILVSKDAGLRIIANSLGIKTQDYLASKVKNPEIFSDATPKIDLTMDQINRLLADGELMLPIPDTFKINSRVVAKELNCVVVEKNKIKILNEESVSDIKPKNLEQQHALWLLTNPNISLVALSGNAGSGKTLLSIAAGIEQTIGKENCQYKKIVIVRPVIPVGRDIGFLPGDIGEKLEPWMRPIYDALQMVMGDMDKTKVQYLFDQGIIEVAPLPYIRGRSIHNAFIYVDETQNISKHEIKTIITRAGQKTKIVVAGDWDQIDVNFIDKHSCGLAHVINSFQGEKMFGSCNFVKSERSELAELATKLL